MALKNKYSIADGIKRLSGRAQYELFLAECLGVQKLTYKLNISVPYLGLAGQIDYHPASSSDKKFTIWPRVGSMVVVGRMEGSDQLFVVSVINPDVVELNGNAFSMVKGESLKVEVEKLKAAVNQIKSAIQGAAVAPGDGGAVFKANILAALAVFDTGNFSQILNEEVKHG
jgi:hypothetical protein